jgi:adenine-specific DNA-methyltransferase
VRKKATGPTPVDAITHADKRANLPTADAHEFVTPEIEQPRSVSYSRVPVSEPQLVWAGRDEHENDDLVAEAPPIYIQEKVDPRVLIENLRRTAERPEDEPELTLFESFDGLGDLDLVDFYRHEANWSNRMILGDSLNVMASLSEREALRGKVQAIYLDPPYGIKFRSNWQTSFRTRDVQDGKLAHISREVEQIKAFRDTWELGISSYLSYLRDRLVVARDLLTDSGSIFVQISDDNVHLVRSLLDEVFGSRGYLAQIAFAKTTSASSSRLASVFDYLLWYAKDPDAVKTRALFDERAPIENPNERYVCVETPDGRIIDLSRAQKEGKEPIPEGRILRLDNPTSQDPPKDPQPFEFDGRVFHAPRKRHWSVKWPEGMERVRAAGLFHVVGNTLVWKNYRDEGRIKPINNIWTNLKPSGFGEGNIYVVQTIAEVVERCVLMATDPGDLVLDPTCGSGTTAYVAERRGRRWITIDTSRVALALARQRIATAIFPAYLLLDTPEGRAKEGELSGQSLPGAETTGNVRHGFVYQRGSTVSLGDVSKNPDIREGMTREEIDAAIRRHAELQLLYDKPLEDNKRIRVAGPFTVESLSPHRSLGFAGSAVDESGAVNVSDVDDAGHGDAEFEQSILANLQAAGIQNGRKNERLEMDSIESYAGKYIQAVGAREDAPEGTPKRVGITIGPQYGTVGPAFVKDAAREAIKDASLDLLCVLGFAFDPQVVGVQNEYAASADDFAEVAAERKLGRIPVLLVRMNADLVMGEELKKTGAGNLFTVFGEPDVRIRAEGDEVRVELEGVDVYDPNTGELRSDDTSQIALWMIDSDYDGESFFVRHCYFTGAQTPYERLKRALKAEIDEDAWDELYSTVSRPFAKPSTGRIAVKVINDYGDEVMKVFDV